MQVDMNTHTDVPVKDVLLRLLLEAGTDKIPHSGRFLLDHLVGTYHLLVDWSNPAHVCTAGLLHSIYGTQTFGPHALERRERGRVRSIVGHQAEELVYLFGVCDRDRFFRSIDEPSPLLHDRIQNRRILVAPRTLHALIEMEVANMLEQIPHKQRISQVVMDTYQRQCQAARPVLSDAGYRHAQKMFAEHTAATTKSIQKRR